VDHLRNANAIIRKHLLAADGLDLVMIAMNPPCRQRPFVLPDLIGQQQVFAGQAAEAVDEEATAHRIERGPQRRGEVEILIPVARPGLDFKEQRDHRSPPPRPTQPARSSVSRMPS